MSTFRVIYTRFHSSRVAMPDRDSTPGAHPVIIVLLLQSSASSWPLSCSLHLPPLLIPSPLLPSYQRKQYVYLFPPHLCLSYSPDYCWRGVQLQLPCIPLQFPLRAIPLAPDNQQWRPTEWITRSWFQLSRQERQWPKAFICSVLTVLEEIQSRSGKVFRDRPPNKMPVNFDNEVLTCFRTVLLNTHKANKKQQALLKWHQSVWGLSSGFPWKDFSDRINMEMRPQIKIIFLIQKIYIIMRFHEQILK